MKINPLENWNYSSDSLMICKDIVAKAGIQQNIIANGGNISAGLIFLYDDDNDGAPDHYAIDENGDGNVGEKFELFAEYGEEDLINQGGIPIRGGGDNRI